MEHIPHGVYTPEFRSEAVKLVENEGLSVDQAAKRFLVPKSSLGNWVRAWTALVRYASDGRVEIDNNAAERSLRTVARGWNNYLFLVRMLVVSERLPWIVADQISTIEASLTTAA